MDFQTLNNSINRGVIASVYLLHGSERLLMEQSIKKLQDKILPEGLEAFNLDIIDGNKASPHQVVDLANMMPVMAAKRLVIVDNPQYFIASKVTEGKTNDKPLIEYLKNPNTGCCLIFKIQGKADKRKKLYKAVEKAGQVIEFGNLKGKYLENWIVSFIKERGKKIEPDALAYLTILGTSGLENLQNELEKLVLYCGDQLFITLQMTQEIVVKNSEINIFTLIDSIANKEGKQALELLHTSLALGEPPLKLLYLLVRQFRLILISKDMVSQGYSEKQIREKLQAHPYVVSKVLGQGRRFTMAQLVNSLKKLLETEVLLKSSGGDPGELLENLVIGLCYS